MTRGGFDGGFDPNAEPPVGYPAGYPGGYPPPPAAGYPGGYPPPGGYQPAPQPGPGGWGIQPGGLGVRFAARVIDGLLVGIVAGLLAVLLGVSRNIMVTGLFSGVLMFVYFVVMEMTQGRTLAKSLLGLRVHGPGGAPRPTAQQSAIRNSFTLLTVIPYIGGLLAVIAYIVIAVTISNSPTKQGKHDELAGGTQVVKG